MKKLFFGVLIAKIIFVFLFVGIFGEERLIWSDSSAYLNIGRNIFSGHGFSSSSGESPIFTPNTVRTPIYPFLIGFFDRFVPHGLVVVSLLQAALVALIAMLIYQLAIRFLAPRWVLGVALIASFEPLISVIHILVMPETLLLLFLLLFLISFLRYLDDRRISDLLLSAFWLGIATMTKPVALYLFIVPLLFIMWRGRRVVVHAAAFVTIFLLLLLPWAARNYTTAGVVGVTTDDAANICGWTLSGILATKYRIDSSNFDILYAHPEYQKNVRSCASTGAALKFFMTQYPVDFAKAMLLSSIAMLTNDGYAAFFEKAPAEENRSDQWVAPVKIHHNYLTPAVLTNRDWPQRLVAAMRELRPIERVVVIAGKLFWLVISLGALGGMWQLLVKKRSLHAFFLVLVIGYFIAAAVVTNAYGVGARLRFPINPLLFLFAILAARRAAYYFFNHVFWPPLHFFKNAPDVLSDDGKR